MSIGLERLACHSVFFYPAAAAQFGPAAAEAWKGARELTTQLAGIRRSGPAGFHTVIQQSSCGNWGRFRSMNSSSNAGDSSCHESRVSKRIPEETAIEGTYALAASLDLGLRFPSLGPVTLHALGNRFAGSR
jgi:hypothetical protein